MGWNLGMAIVANEPLDALDLDDLLLGPRGYHDLEQEEVWEAVTRRDADLNVFGVARWREVALVVHRFAMEEGWEDLEADLVFAFSLSENHQTNAFRVLERGAVVREWSEWEPDFEDLHPLERGLRHEGVHPADYIQAIAERLLGVGLFTSEFIDAVELVAYRRG